MQEALVELGEHIRAQNPQSIAEIVNRYDELTISTQPTAIVRILSFLRDDPRCSFGILVDLCGADYPQRERRFDVVYHLLSLTNNQRVRVKIATDADTPVPSVVSVFSSAGWYEREAWDLFGILFSRNPDLRRILCDYGFEGHPLRKDFPLTGYSELRYDPQTRRVVYQPVHLPQAYRDFDFVSPWEGMNSLLPGDEKATEEEPGQ